jgi:hypothetical protein
MIPHMITPSHLESAPVKKIVAVWLLTLVACGKRGDPRPPVPVIPQATSDLVVTQRGTRVLLAWSFPALTTAGQSLSIPKRVVVYRYAEELPVAPGGRDPNAMLPGDIDPTQPEPVARFAKVPLVTPAQFNKLRERIDSIESANLPEATAGAKLTYEDTPPVRGKEGRPLRLTYAVVTEGQTARSDLSNLAVIVPLDVPAAPGDLTATAEAKGIVLSWTKPSSAAAGDAAPFLAGYNIYCAAASETTDDLGSPINAAPVTGTTYTDTPPYGSYSYRVTAVASPGPPRVESDPSPRVIATFKDLVPPPPPTNLTALVETKAVRLVWDKPDAPDLRGYLVYRTEGNVRLKLSPGPVTAPFFLDISAQPGATYVYSVSSVDTNLNESAPVSGEPVLIPRTP